MYDRWTIIANGIYPASYLIDLRFDPSELREEELESAKKWFEKFVKTFLYFSAQVFVVDTVQLKIYFIWIKFLNEGKMLFHRSTKIL